VHITPPLKPKNKEQLIAALGKPNRLTLKFLELIKKGENGELDVYGPIEYEILDSDHLKEIFDHFGTIDYSVSEWCLCSSEPKAMFYSDNEYLYEVILHAHDSKISFSGPNLQGHFIISAEAFERYEELLLKAINADKRMLTELGKMP
jgi:hypothetical protein